MAWVTMEGTCVCCHQFFVFHPNRVPSLRIKGVRQPVCRSCIEAVNPLRIAKGLPPIEILPGAYEGAEEGEIMWDD